jgi:flagellar biosynthetic protein FlhB
MADSAQDKTERATPKRKKDARKQGQLPRSRELSAAAVTGAGALAVVAGAHGLAEHAAAMMRDSLTVDPELLVQTGQLPVQLMHTLLQGLMLVVPVLAATACTALIAPLLLGGWNFSFEALIPKFSRLNPLTGVGRIFSSHGAAELGKGIAKVLCIGAVATIYLWNRRSALIALSAESPAHGIADGAAIVLGAGSWLVGALLIIAAIDAPYQIWSFAKQMRMSKQEVRDEMKHTEGRPEVKGRIRKLQYEMSKRRMMQSVPTADVVITNPTHYAVAIQYSSKDMRAPRVVAKGAGEVAAAIRDLARDHRVPLVSAPPLARALYRGVELDREIPASLYAAVARVLTYVYQLRSWRGGARPSMPAIDAVPGGEPDE